VRAKRRVSAAEFDAVRPFLKISDERVKAARGALVEGLTLQVLGQRFGWTRQAVGDAVSTVWRTLETYRESQRLASSADTVLPPGWVKVTLIAPTHLIERFKTEIAELSEPPDVPALPAVRVSRNMVAKKTRPL